MTRRQILHALACAYLALVLSLNTVPLCAQAPALVEAPAPTRYAPAIEFARTLVQAMMEESGTPGMSVAVGIDGEIVWSEGFGFADVEDRAPVWEETKFRIGSVSKSMTAAAVGLLYEQGLLDLDAPVQRYVPSFPEKRWPITTRLVAGHLAGVRHYRDDEAETLSKRYNTVLEGLEIFQDDTLLFEPGTRYEYSSYGWNLISAVVEGASGESFLAYMQEHVFEPLGMHHTVADHTDSIIPHRTRFYERTEDGHVLNAPYVDNSYKWAGGGFLSTPEDLVRFGTAHLGDELLKRETIEMLWTSQRTNDGAETNYGIGWRVDRDGGRVSQAHHSGGSVGGRTFLLILPQERAVAAMVGNRSQAPPHWAPTLMILEAFLDPEALTAEASGPDIAGIYECTALVEGEEPSSGTVEIRGSAAGYWGREVWDDERGRIIYSSSRREATTLISVDQDGVLSRTRFTSVERNRLAGEQIQGGRRGEVSCSRR
jgi:CubicO group peptidase (beta-lactamase class C family)